MIRFVARAHGHGAASLSAVPGLGVRVAVLVAGEDRDDAAGGRAGAAPRPLRERLARHLGEPLAGDDDVVDVGADLGDDGLRVARRARRAGRGGRARRGSGRCSGPRGSSSSMIGLASSPVRTVSVRSSSPSASSSLSCGSAPFRLRTAGSSSTAASASSFSVGIATGAVSRNSSWKGGSSSIVWRELLAPRRDRVEHGAARRDRPGDVVGAEAAQGVGGGRSARDDLAERALVAGRGVELLAQVGRERLQVLADGVQALAPPGDALADVDDRPAQRLARLLVEQLHDLEQVHARADVLAGDRVAVLHRVVAVAGLDLEVGLVDDRVHADVGGRVLADRSERGLRDVRRDGGAARLAVRLDLADQAGELT